MKFEFQQPVLEMVIRSAIGMLTDSVSLSPTFFSLELK